MAHSAAAAHPTKPSGFSVRDEVREACYCNSTASIYVSLNSFIIYSLSQQWMDGGLWGALIIEEETLIVRQSCVRVCVCAHVRVWSTATPGKLDTFTYDIYSQTRRPLWLLHQLCMMITSSAVIYVMLTSTPHCSKPSGNAKSQMG